MASSDENVSDSDEDMISCHHYFCLSCIKSFSKPKCATCPTCRTSTDLTARKIERLTTNNIALRLVAISEDRARERQEHETVEKEIMDQQLWCSECNMSATNECHKKEHAILSYFDIYNSHSSLLKSVISETNAVCDRALEHHQKIYSTLLEMFAKVRWLESQIILRVESSKASISHLESLKSKEDFKEVPAEEDMVNTVNQMNQLIVQITERSDLAKAAELEACELLKTYGSNSSTFLISLLETEQCLPEGLGLGSNGDGVDKCGELNDLKKKYGLSKDENNMVEDEVVKSQDYTKPVTCSLN
ncbi:hypothetical protein DAPPUDRAFT_241167 [Daphnia pulex]|uniref:RING-type domain-containing protein n=1 Tax=Daphnia pulex TaxID=6669 RepID=E9GDK8_DAPPU|nr:hypothetical protein DAPPUDRAFT_241167 [Daphnia pulex]|eukprot:EFX82099.1 hypothetical protein DAPPUDRAFT_241167 [Daphnia pulex]